MELGRSYIIRSPFGLLKFFMPLGYMWVVRMLRVGSEFSSGAIPAGEVFLIEKKTFNNQKRADGTPSSTKKIIYGFRLLCLY